MFDRENRGGSASRYADLVVDVLNVMADGFWSDIEGRRHLAIGVPLCHQPKDGDFSIRQTARVRWLRHSWRFTGRRAEDGFHCTRIEFPGHGVRTEFPRRILYGPRVAMRATLHHRVVRICRCDDSRRHIEI